MLQFEAPAKSSDQPLNSYVDSLACRLVEAATANGTPINEESWVVIDEVLSFAAEAEENIARQKERIAYLETISGTDELTGLPNRRAVQQFGAKLLARYRRFGEFGVLGLLDLDHFKEINDTFGHEAGDRALRHVARILSLNTRTSDFAARLGGDEFVVILDHSDWKKGSDRLHMIRDLIGSQPLKWGRRTITLKASLGLQKLGPETVLRDIFSEADNAMYDDKRERRSRPASLASAG